MDASLFSAFGLASAAGFNAFVPLLSVGLLARYTDLVRLAEPFDILTQPWMLGVLAALALIDFIADKVPALDHLWHGLGALVSPAAGAVLFASQQNVLSDLHPAVAALAGLVVAGGFHGGRAAARPISTAATGGLGNPVLSLLEDVLSAILTAAALLLPLLAFGLGIGLLILLILAAWGALRRRPKATGLDRRSTG